jgi:Xaa-Pro aminopeptidase
MTMGSAPSARGGSFLGGLSLALLVGGASVGSPAWGQEAPAHASRAEAADDEALRAAAFAPDALRERRRALLKALPEGAVVVVAAGKRDGDDTWLYRPHPDFLYLSGLRDPDCSLILGPGLDLLVTPPKSARWELWNGPRIAPGSPEAAASGFGEVIDTTDKVDRLKQALAKGGSLYLVGCDATDLGLEPPPHAPRRAELNVADLRQVKSPAEVALLGRAIDITGAALTEAIRSIEPGQTEFEVQGVIEYLFLRYGAQRPGFASIVGSGPNSCVLHYQTNRRRIGPSDLVVMDVGAELWGYTADVTRTVPASGKFTPRQREIYELVLAAQEAGFKAVKPGATIQDVHQAARAVIARAGHARAFPHGTSHWLGMDVHDVGAMNRPLEVGMVLTVEPGIYLAAEELGVRIEDDVVVTADGCRILSERCPRTVEAIEALLAERGVGNAPVATPEANGAKAPPASDPSAPGGPGRRFFRVR